MVTRCELSASCNYCSLSSTLPSVSDERLPLTIPEVLKGVRFAVSRGVSSIVLVGGTDLDGSDERVRTLVSRIRARTQLPLGLDVGPSLSEPTIRWLEERNVTPIYCSMETIDRRLFEDAKPGDDLDARLRFMDVVERTGGHLGNITMNGLGTPDDLLRTILASRRFPHSTHLHISTFHPVPGTPWARRRPASRATSLKALAIARLAFPSVELGLAEVGVENPKDLTSVASQLAAGGGNTLASVLLYKRVRIDHTDRIRQQLSDLGFTAS
jgi:biotin synthase